MASSSERLANVSAQDFQQALNMYAELTFTMDIKDVGLSLAYNLWRAGLESSPIIDRILQDPSLFNKGTFHSIAEFYRDTGNFRQMRRMLIAARSEPGFFDDFWLTSARKRHEFGQDPQQDLDKVRDHIETKGEFYDKYRGYSRLAEATYDVTGQSQEELLTLAKEDWRAVMDKHHGNVSDKNRSEYRQGTLSRSVVDIATAYGHCGDYKEALEFYDMLDPTVVSKDDKRLRSDILLTRERILFSIVQSCFRNGSYSEGFELAEQWFDSHKKLTRDCFESDRQTVVMKITLSEVLYHEGKANESKTMLRQARKGITVDEPRISDRLSLVDRYQEALLKVVGSSDSSLYDLALQDVDSKPSDAHVEPIRNPYEIASKEREGQLALRMKVDDYSAVSNGYAQIGKFDKAKEALSRVDQFGDADDEIKKVKVEALSYIAYQEKRRANTTLLSPVT